MFGMVPFGHSEDYLFKLYDNFAHNFFHDSGKALPDFRADIWDDGSAYILEAELPGFKKEDIRLDLKDRLLTISASRKTEPGEQRSYVLQERKSIAFRRSFDVTGINEDAISATYENGLLRLTMPKMQATAGAGKQIEIL